MKNTLPTLLFILSILGFTPTTYNAQYPSTMHTPQETANIITAIQNGNFQQVQDLVPRQVQYNTPIYFDGRHTTPLAIAEEYAFLQGLKRNYYSPWHEIAHYLIYQLKRATWYALEKYINNSKSPEQWKLLITAIKTGDLNSVENIVPTSINYKDKIELEIGSIDPLGIAEFYLLFNTNPSINDQRDLIRQYLSPESQQWLQQKAYKDWLAEFYQ